MESFNILINYNNEENNAIKHKVIDNKLIITTKLPAKLYLNENYKVATSFLSYANNVNKQEYITISTDIIQKFCYIYNNISPNNQYGNYFNVKKLTFDSINIEIQLYDENYNLLYPNLQRLFLILNFKKNIVSSNTGVIFAQAN